MTPVATRPADARWASLSRPIAAAAAAVGALTIVATVDPNEPGHYPTCPFLAVTGHSCPGCGSLRALHALAHGDLLAAIARNALTVASLPLLVWLWTQWARRCWTGDPRRHAAPAAALWAGVAVVVAFWVGRNLGSLPIGAALAP